MQVTVNDILKAANGKLLNGNGDTEINGFFTNSRETHSLPFKNALFCTYNRRKGRRPQNSSSGGKRMALRLSL